MGFFCFFLILVIVLRLAAFYFKYLDKPVQRHRKETRSASSSHSSSNFSSTSNPRSYFYKMAFDDFRQLAAKEGFIAIDFETTGLDPKNDQIIEIGAIYYGASGREIARFNALVRPTIPIPAEATVVNHITDSMVAFSPSIASVLPEFCKRLEFWNAPLVAYNADFDIRFLRTALSRHNISLRAKYFDAYEYAKMRFSGLKRYNLESVCQHIGHCNLNQHRAAGDAAAVAAVVQYAIKNYRYI